MTALPDKPSELLEVALRDLEACRNDPRYTIDLEKCHEPIDGQCNVCLAGAVIAKSLHFAPSQCVVVSKSITDMGTYKKLLALDNLRSGSSASFILRTISPGDAFAWSMLGDDVNAVISRLNSSYPPNAHRDVDRLLPWLQTVLVKLKEVGL
jgi:hypothetical protein